jgi:aspartate/glutamate racemase
MMSSPLIALISAVPAAIGPARDAVVSAMPQARVWNILDDRLLVDADEQGAVTPHLADRMRRLIQHAIAEGADGVLLTCSLYGPVAATVLDSAVPILAADSSAFDAAVTGDYREVVVVASLQSAAADSVSRLSQAGVDAGVSWKVSSEVVEAAFAATKAGDNEALFAALTTAIDARHSLPDAFVLAQYSLAPVAERLEARYNIPVISGPQRAASALREAVGNE